MTPRSTASTLLRLVLFGVVASCQAAPEARPEAATEESPAPAEEATFQPSDETFAPFDGLEGSSVRLFTGTRPQFSPDGRWVAFHHSSGERLRSYIAALETGLIYPLVNLPGDVRDPTWTHDSEHIIFASDHDGESFDLYRVRYDGTDLTRLTDLPGDTLEPTLSPLTYDLNTLLSDSCGRVKNERRIDTFEKVAFTYRTPEGAEEVWFSSLQPDGFIRGNHDRFRVPGETGTYAERVSPEGLSCRTPAYSGDGLHLTYACGDDSSVIYDASRRLDHSYSRSKRFNPIFDHSCNARPGHHGPLGQCIAGFTPRHADHEGTPRPAPETNLYRPRFSLNHTHLIADDGESVFVLDRFADEPEWRPLEFGQEGAPSQLRNPFWLPSGAGIALDDGDSVFVVPTDYYLQDVVNLHLFPELIREPSAHLAEQGMLSRPSPRSEIYLAYQWLAVRHRPHLVTADAMIYAYLYELLHSVEFSATDLRLDAGPLSLLIDHDELPSSPTEDDDLAELIEGITELLKSLATNTTEDSIGTPEATRGEPWSERLLASALGGYVHLVHPAIPYSTNDLSRNCTGDTTIFALAELPIHRPRGSVDPLPEFFEGLANIAGPFQESAGYRRLYRRTDPVAAMAAELANISRAQLNGEPLTRDQYTRIETIGAALEIYALGSVSYTGQRRLNPNFEGPGQGLRVSMGSGEDAPETHFIGTGPTERLYLLVPETHSGAQRLTEGVIFSGHLGDGETTEP